MPECDSLAVGLSAEDNQLRTQCCGEAPRGCLTLCPEVALLCGWGGLVTYQGLPDTQRTSTQAGASGFLETRNISPLYGFFLKTARARYVGTLQAGTVNRKLVARNSKDF